MYYLKKFSFFAILIIFFPPNSALSANGTTFEIDRVVGAIKEEIQSVRATETGSPRLKIDGFDLELSVVTTKKGEAGLKLMVAGIEVGGGVGISKAASHKITLIMKPVGPVLKVGSKHSLGLLPAIQSAKAAIKNAFNTPPPFTLDKFDFEVTFTVEKKAEGGIKFIIIDAGSIEYKKYATNKIIIHMSLSD